MLQTGSFCARRDFLKALIAAPALGRVLLAHAVELRLGIVYDTANRDALLGARMSVQESSRAAALLGDALNAFELEMNGQAGPREWLESNRVAAVVVACQPQRLAQLLKPLTASGAAVINCAAPPDTVPGLCPTTVRSVLPVSAQLHDAVVWDDSLERFGAAQLNARYRAAFHAPMNSAAWCGWFAVKLLWESAARAGAGDASALQAFLASPRAAFDGHKGDILTFGPARVLRQPLYRMSNGAGRVTVTEIAPDPAGEWKCP